MAVRVIAAFAVLTVVVLVGVALMSWVLHGRVTGSSLLASLAIETQGVDSDEYDRCDRIAGTPRTWECVLPNVSDVGSGIYRVTVKPGSSCWTAVRTSGPEYGDSPRHAEGCVHRWQWTLLPA